MTKTGGEGTDSGKGRYAEGYAGEDLILKLENKGSTSTRFSFYIYPPPVELHDLS